MADANKNNYCTLAELDSFILKKLVSKYPKTMEKAKKAATNGFDIFNAFRPCYIRAFADAKDFKKDNGRIIPGFKGKFTIRQILWLLI